MIYLITLLLLFNTGAYSQLLPVISPDDAGFDSQRLQRVDEIIQASIDNNETPGAVLVVLRDTAIVYQKAYGLRQRIPERKEMDISTVFDLASLTKPVATATAIFILAERGEIRLLDPVSRYIPGFTTWHDRETDSEHEIRIIHLLTHTSGLPSYPPVDRLVSDHGSPAPEAVVDYLSTLERHIQPGTSFTYSCPNFVMLQQIVEKVSGTTIAEFCNDNIFRPLGMSNTAYNPPAEMYDRIAPTTFENEVLLTGVVHDPFARKLMGGISGNAGLFSNAHDLAVYTAMLLNNGTINGTRILSPLSISALITIPKGYEQFGRSPGWDLHSSFATNQGDLFGEQTFGHTGYTGTSMVIDPETRTAVILLTNRVHPDDSTSVVRLRSLVANVVAGAIID
jgi:serine-type D-Ala-D-Ala carboxypeptidase